MSASPISGLRERTVEELLRLLLLALFLVSTLGTWVELLLLGHYDDLPQYVPLVLLVLGLISGTVLLMRPERRPLTMFRWVMILFVFGGLVGLALHYRGNVEFEREMYPSLGGLELFWEAIRGATPALAPGTLTKLGLLGLVITFRHPRWLAGARDAVNEPIEEVPDGEK